MKSSLFQKTTEKLFKLKPNLNNKHIIFFLNSNRYHALILNTIYLCHNVKNVFAIAMVRPHDSSIQTEDPEMNTLIFNRPSVHH